LTLLGESFEGIRESFDGLSEVEASSLSSSSFDPTKFKLQPNKVQASFQPNRSF
jgi:hypothetical protein